MMKSGVVAVLEDLQSSPSPPAVDAGAGAVAGAGAGAGAVDLMRVVWSVEERRSPEWR